MLDFEGPIEELQNRIQGLKLLPPGEKSKTKEEIQRLEEKCRRKISELYRHLTPWQKVLVARHPERPKTKDYIARMMERFVPLAGDRCFAEDLAITVGIAWFRGHPLMVIGHEKGDDTQERIRHNFGMPHPEGYRKALRSLELAERFHLPVVTFVDTPGAYAGFGAEERGQGEAIARCIEKSLMLSVPILTFIIGEGGSGGALALATANHITMLEHSVYSVISPEGCASILWRTNEKKEEAAKALKLTAQDLLSWNIIDEIIREPMGGAQRNRMATIDAIADALERQLSFFAGKAHLKQHRREKFLAMGRIAEK
jgi:acetyl-CoA carboxylase carboxyl transferase subunit alpha